MSDIHEVSIEKLKEHPRNAGIYGAEENIDDLVELIKHSKWCKPLLVTADLTVVSGHRRLRAVKRLGWERIPVSVEDFETEEDILKRLLNENLSRHKTPLQMAKELELWRTFYKTNNPAKKNEPANSSPGRNTTTLGQASKHLGISERQAHTLIKVNEKIADLESKGKQKEGHLLKVVLDNESVNAAKKLFESELLEKLANDDEQYRAITEGRKKVKEVKPALAKSKKQPENTVKKTATKKRNENVCPCSRVVEELERLLPEDLFKEITAKLQN
jgi:hypothetical protein